MTPVRPVGAKSKKPKGTGRVRFADEEVEGKLVEVVDIEPITIHNSPDVWMRWTSYNWTCHEIGEGVEQPEEPSSPPSIPASPQSPSSLGVPCVPKGCAADSCKCFSDGQVNELVQASYDDMGDEPTAEYQEQQQVETKANLQEAGHTSEECNAEVVEPRVSLLPLATSQEGCLVVRRTIQEARRSGEEQGTIAAEFHGHVKNLIASPYGCEVLQSCVELMLPSCSHFIAMELTGVAAATARNPTGYLVMCRVLAHHPPSELFPLIEELLSDISGMCRHPKANIVLQNVFDYGLASHKMRIAEALAADLECLGRHRSGSHVVEKVLLSLDEAPRTLLAATAIQTPSILVALACNRQSKFVIQHFLELPGRDGEVVRSLLLAADSQLRATKYGSHVADALAAGTRPPESETSGFE